MTNVLSIESSALYYAAWFRFHLEDERGAREYLERALAGAEELGSPDGIADCLHQIANVDLAERRFPEAEEGYRRVLEIRESRRDREAQARVHEALGDVNLTKEDHPGAIAEYEIAARIAEEIGDRLSWANTRYRIARIQYQEGDIETCRLALRDVIKVQREFGDRRDEIVALTLLSDAEYSAENVAGAHAAAARALELSREIGSRHQADLLHRLATTDLAQERTGRARSGYESAVAKAEKDGQLDVVVTSGIALGCLELESGNRKAAKAKLKAALKVAMSIGAQAQIAEIQSLLAELS
jgi:tetratricopeptide (TPR) repeat protein